MIRNLLSFYLVPRYAMVVTYMLQNTEYQAKPYLAWYWRTQDFSKVLYRRDLHDTKAARLLRYALILGMTLQIILGLVLIALWKWRGLTAGDYFGAAILLSYPIVWAHFVVIPLSLGRLFIVLPHEKRLIEQSSQLFAKHPGIKIAIAGSYGKTSMKELLLTVLSEGKKVAATPANKNVASSHAQFVSQLAGDEDVLILEYGEGKPGDVRRFAQTTQPTHGVITGLAPAHLDQYKSLSAAGEDIFALAEYLDGKQVYVNGDSSETTAFFKETYHIYNTEGCLGWKTKNIQLTTTSTSFELHNGRRKMLLCSGLIGKHQVGPLSVAAVLGLEIGLNEEQVVAGVAKTVPFEHRMQPYTLNGAWVIDDTYNGNIEGVRAGTALLKSLDAVRKLYVTPGLVDQGNETKNIHEQMGVLIAAAKPDIVVLMKNSVTPYIEKGLKQGLFGGELRIETDPLGYYRNLDQHIATGDLVLMQNDWPDNYK